MTEETNYDGQTWGDIARHHKDLKGMSMANLAKEAGVSYPTLIKYLNNERTLPRDTSVVYRIADALGIDAKLLIEPMVLAATKGNGGDMSPEDRAFLTESIQRELERRAESGEAIKQDNPNEGIEYTQAVGAADQPFRPVAMWTVPEAITADLVGPCGFWRMQDDTMSPVIAKGAKVFVDFGHVRPAPDGIYLINDGFGPILKRVERVGRSWRMSTDSSKSQSEEVDLTDGDVGIKVLGRAIHTLNPL